MVWVNEGSDTPADREACIRTAEESASSPSTDPCRKSRSSPQRPDPGFGRSKGARPRRQPSGRRRDGDPMAPGSAFAPSPVATTSPTRTGPSRWCQTSDATRSCSTLALPARQIALGELDRPHLASHRHRAVERRTILDRDSSQGHISIEHRDLRQGSRPRTAVKAEAFLRSAGAS